MPDPLAQIQQDTLDAENAGLAAARTNASWANTFSQVPDVERLRATRNLNEMVATAIDRRQKVAAQGDEAAQRIYYNKQKFDAWQGEQPNRAALLQAQIDHENAMTDAAGAHDFYTVQRDKESADDFAGMATELSQRPSHIALGTPEYHDWIFDVASRHKAGALTTAGREILQREAGMHDDAAKFDLQRQALDLRKQRLEQTERQYSTEGLFPSAEAATEKYPGAQVAQSQSRRGFYYITHLRVPKDDSIAALAKDMKSAGLDTGLSVFANPQASSVNEAYSPDVVSVGKDNPAYVPKAVWEGWKTRASALTGGAQTKPPAAAPAPVLATTPEFASIQEAEAAAKAGRIKAGNKIKIGGKTGTWQ